MFVCVFCDISTAKLKPHKMLNYALLRIYER